ncbi:MAG TPA: MFS transporter [Streptosporangiaceae bacterium]|jgi:MFS family permease
MGDSRAAGLWAPQVRALTVGLTLTVTLVASEALAVITVMPVVARDLGGLGLYGWVFSSFMLGSVIGIVAAGREADRRGPAIPFVAGLVLFGAGLVVAGLAPSMAVLIAGRVLQGAGAGAVPALAYASIGRSFAGQARARMMAVLSTAWVAPALAGPVLSAEVAHLFGWRWVFLGLLPVVTVTGALAVPALHRLGPPGPGHEQEHRLTDGVRTAVCATLMLAGLTVAADAGPGGARAVAIAAGAAMVLLGAAAGLPALRRLVPPGTLAARRGLPATILSRGLLTFGFFGADAYVTLTVTVLRHRSPLLASLAVTGATIAWTAGSWSQARLAQTRAGRSLIRAGLLIILAGIAGMVVALQPGVPVATALAAWTVAGLGMGMAYPTLSLLMLREAPPGREGWASASLNLADVLGTALGVGVGGAAVTASTGHDLRIGVTAAFAVAAAVLMVAIAVSRRLPDGPSGGPARPAGPAGTADTAGAGSTQPAGTPTVAGPPPGGGTARLRISARCAG